MRFQEFDSERARDFHKIKKAQCSSSIEIPRGHGGSKAKKTLKEQDLGEQLAEVELQAAHLYMEMLVFDQGLFGWGSEALKA